MSELEFKMALSRCSFLFDWQKEKLMAMLGSTDDDADVYGNGNGHIRADDVFPVVDNVLWRVLGVGLDSLPTGDRMSIEYAVREIAR